MSNTDKQAIVSFAIKFCFIIAKIFFIKDYRGRIELYSKLARFFDETLQFSAELQARLPTAPDGFESSILRHFHSSLDRRFNFCTKLEFTIGRLDEFQATYERNNLTSYHRS